MVANCPTVLLLLCLSLFSYDIFNGRCPRSHRATHHDNIPHSIMVNSGQGVSTRAMPWSCSPCSYSGGSMDRHALRTLQWHNKILQGHVRASTGFQGYRVCAEMLQHIKDGLKPKVLYSAPSFTVDGHS